VSGIGSAQWTGQPQRDNVDWITQLELPNTLRKSDNDADEFDLSIVVIVGPPAAGKSTIAGQLTNHLSLQVVAVDQHRAHYYGPVYRDDLALTAFNRGGAASLHSDICDMMVDTSIGRQGETAPPGECALGASSAAVVDKPVHGRNTKG
jgi:hypothetical protein